MRDHYDLKGGRPNPHAAKIGREERAALRRVWSTTAKNESVGPRVASASNTKPMHKEYDFSQSRPNPYVARLGPKGRADLLRWWSRVAGNVRLLPEDLAREFPDTKSTVAALRLVMKLRKAASKATPSRNGRLRRSKRRTG